MYGSGMTRSCVDEAAHQTLCGFSPGVGGQEVSEVSFWWSDRLGIEGMGECCLVEHAQHSLAWGGRKNAVLKSLRSIFQNHMFWTLPQGIWVSCCAGPWCHQQGDRQSPQLLDLSLLWSPAGTCLGRKLFGGRGFPVPLGCVQAGRNLNSH